MRTIESIRPLFLSSRAQRTQLNDDLSTEQTVNNIHRDFDPKTKGNGTNASVEHCHLTKTKRQTFVFVLRFSFDDLISTQTDVIFLSFD